MSNSVDPIFQIGGALGADSVAYVVRDAETEAAKELRRMSYLKVIEPRQQGKTSLINWLSRNLHSVNYSFAVVDVSTLEESNEAAWYDNLQERIRRQMNFISDSVHINSPTTPRTWRRFLADIASYASKAGKYVVIALDEIGTTHQIWAEPFFRILRDVFNSRENEPHFKHMTFLLAGCYNPAGLIQHENESPFNVAVRIRLPDFTYEQVHLLVATHLKLVGEQADSFTRRIYFWTSGQPYLTQLLCYYLAMHFQYQYQADIDSWVQRLLSEDRNHLPPILYTLRKKPGLRQYAERILSGERIRFSPGAGNRRHEQLELIGLIKSDPQGYCAIRNPIYALALSGNTDESTELQIPRSVNSIEVFISYAHADEVLCLELIKHLAGLKRQGLITNWYDRKIGAGTEWEQKVESHLNAAQMILLLISPDFLSSDYCYDVEVKRALQRHEREEALVIPIILRPVLWNGTPFGKLEALPRDGKAVTTWANTDEALLNIAESIRKIIVGSRENKVTKDSVDSTGL